MEAVLQGVLINAVLVLALAVCVWGITRLTRRPAMAHVLWLLVLVKLVTPPFLSVPIPQFWALEPSTHSVPKPAAEPLPHRVPAEPRFDDFAKGTPGSGGPVDAKPTEMVVPTPSLPWSWVVAGCWAAGSLAWAAVATLRIHRFHRALRLAEPAGGRVAVIAAEAAARLGLKRCPPVLLADAHVPPMVWPVGWTPRLVLPRKLADALDDERLALVLGHELAHVRRRDHLIRWFELTVLILFWWHPVAWWASRKVADAADQCCDALVLQGSPQCGRAYAEALLQSAEFLAANPPANPLPAAGLGSGSLLRRRCEMALKGKLSSRLGWLGGALVLATLVLVPLSCHFHPSGEEGENEANKPDVTTLGTINDHRENPFRIQPYVRVAVQLQAMGEKERVDLLREWAQDHKHDEQVIVLCRMLFEPKEGGEFRRPLLGAPVLLGDTNADDWPLEPITLWEDVPVLVVRGYALGGRAEPAASYLDYCLEHCRWTSRKFNDVENGDLARRLDRLVKAKVWKRRLKASEIEFIKMQGDFAEDFRRYVNIGGIDPKRADHVIALLDEQGIPSIVEGSRMYGVQVPPEHAEHALALLTADVAQHGYGARLETLEKIEQQIAAKMTVRAGLKRFKAGAEWKAADAVALTALDAFVRRHGKPPKVPGNPPLPVQWVPPTHSAFLDLPDGTRIEFELIPTSSLIRRREGPRDKLLKEYVGGWTLLDFEGDRLRDAAYQLVLEAVYQGGRIPAEELHNCYWCIGRRVSVIGQIRVPSKPLHPWVLPTADGDIYIPVKVDEKHIGTPVVVSGVIRLERGTKAPPGVAGVPEHYFFDVDSVTIRPDGK